MTREAQVFHLLDMIDSRYEMLTNTLAEGVDAEGLTGFCLEWQAGKLPEPDFFMRIHKLFG
jgi:hypothetical protein